MTLLVKDLKADEWVVDCAEDLRESLSYSYRFFKVLEKAK